MNVKVYALISDMHLIKDEYGTHQMIFNYGDSKRGWGERELLIEAKRNGVDEWEKKRCKLCVRGEEGGRI